MIRKSYISVFILLLIIGCILFYLYKNELNNNALIIKKKVIESEFDISYGSSEAPLTMYLFMDYSCSHCKRFLRNTFPELKSIFIDSGRIRFNIKLISFSNNANIQKAYKTAVCLNQYGDFEKFNELLLYEFETIYSDEFDSLVDDYINRNTFFANCLLSGKSEEYLLTNMKIFVANDFSGTPTFVINNKVYKGYMTIEKISEILNKELNNL